jgi:hypothetical protein
MRKNAAQPVTCLVSAHDVDPVETHLFVCTFDNMRWDTPREALQAAWKEWARQEDLTAFIKHHGTNWGDSTCIPSKVLLKAGITKYENAMRFGKYGTKSIRIPKIDMDFDTDHNESLFDLAEFSRIQDLQAHGAEDVPEAEQLCQAARAAANALRTKIPLKKLEAQRRDAAEKAWNAASLPDVEAVDGWDIDGRFWSRKVFWSNPDAESTCGSIVGWFRVTFEADSAKIIDQYNQ